VMAATDLSDPSLRAVDRGFQIAAVTGARYSIVHALGLDPLSWLREFVTGDAARLAEQAAERQRRALQAIASDPSRNLGVAASIHIEEGRATSAIRTFADEHDVDLILVGAHGAGFVQRVLIGSTASRVLRTSTRPVLVVRESREQPYSRALVAVDFSPASALELSTVRAVAPDAELVLLHIYDSPLERLLHLADVSEDVIQMNRVTTASRHLDRLHELAAGVGLEPERYTALVNHGDVVQQIVAHEISYDCDLVVMGKHGTHMTEELLLGSYTSHVLAESRSDVMVVVDSRHGPVESAIDRTSGVPRAGKEA